MRSSTTAWVWKSRIQAGWVTSTEHGNYGPFPTWKAALYVANIAVSIPDDVWDSNKDTLNAILQAGGPEAFWQDLTAGPEDDYP